MTKIILFGNQADVRMTLPLCHSLSENGGTLYYGIGCISEYSSVSPEFAVFETDSLDCCHADRTILLFKSAPSQSEPSFSPCETLAIVSEFGNSAAMRFASKYLFPLTTYGMGEDSCISVSSLGDKQAVISVHQSIELLSGKILEPCEFTVKYKQQPDSYILLPICAIMILCEKFSDSEMWI